MQLNVGRVSHIFFTIQLVMSVVLKAVQSVTSNVNAASSNELDQFKYCMRQAKQPSLQECIGKTAMNFLQRFEEKDNYTLFSGVVSAKDDKIDGRSIVNFLDADPVDFRGLLENAGAVFSQRNLEWHMDSVYPGLMLKIGPTADANSVAEFVLDPAVVERNFGYEEPSTARILAKQYLLPFLLGLKFNLVALVPLLFAGICLLLKKSLFFAKLAIWISSFLGVGSALGALGSLGGLGGISGGFAGGSLGVGLGGGLGGFVPPPLRGSGQALVNDVGAPAGYFPGKTTVFNHYDAQDEFHHNSPYKRNDRKVDFEKPREYVGRSVTATSSSIADRFYEYEKQVMNPDRTGKLRTSSGKLGPTAFEDAAHSHHNFQTIDRAGWKAVDLRV